jgi:hypothetical protein
VWLTIFSLNTFAFQVEVVAPVSKVGCPETARYVETAISLGMKIYVGTFKVVAC